MVFDRLSLASLQINGVSSNILSRTTALSACLCSGTGLVASNWYLYMKSSLRTRQMKTKWIEASQSVKTKNSIDFWTCLALPASCLAWSMVFCFATLLEVTWINTVKAPVVQVYRGVKLLIGM
ncbi:hypothetical protein GALMADRAFT_1268179 [Galerina marginata CBS 339.88]|uniref:Uncharacterized protein n=1 Tax=Galerina marginata (strain CBS 339.88) TaxID=685588 RepID=A0A067TIF3_GALM3|nr:hypothetical protein GALMADRAFT_1268179 [Galerina marginata CBS 339.88]